MGRRKKYVDTGNPVEDTGRILGEREREYVAQLVSGVPVAQAYVEAGYAADVHDNGKGTKALSSSPALLKLSQPAIQAHTRALLEEIGLDSRTAALSLKEMMLSAEKLAVHPKMDEPVSLGRDWQAAAKAHDIYWRINGAIGPAVASQDNSTSVHIHFGELGVRDPFRDAIDVTPEEPSSSH